MKENLVEALIGAVVLLLAGGFLAFVYERAELRPVDGYELQARFNRVEGLALGSDVRIAGIKVGSVLSQDLDPETYQAIVRFTVDKSVTLDEDTTASISSEGLLGDSYLELAPGAGEEVLVAGDELLWTEDSIDLMSLIGKAIFSSTDDDDRDSDAQ